MPALPPKSDRRDFLKQSAGLAAASAIGLGATEATAKTAADWIARPPAGFTPLHVPGRVVKVDKGTDFVSLMQPNQLWPKQEVARLLLERALTEFTGASNLVEALGKFIHKDDTVALKVNGIAGQHGQSAAFNFELILPVVEGLIQLGVPANKITAFEQFNSYLRGTRLTVPGYDLPKGVQIGFHANRDAVMPSLYVFRGIPTKFVRQVTDATAVIDMTMMKDHSICGFTGALKNMTHGQITNPQDHHAHNCNPQIAMIYNHPVLKSRVRLHITDAFKIIYEGGPLDKYPERRIAHGAVYVSTDPVALDTIGWNVIEEARKANGLKTLKAAGREPGYIALAADLGLGVHDMNAIRLRSVNL
jgi:hypothetical protein